MRPAEARHSPMIVRRQVVLPAPLRPSSMVSEPAATAKSTPCRMWYWPMCVFTPARESSASLAGASSTGSHSEISLLHHRRGDHVGRLAVGDQRALMQHDDAIGERAHHVHLVLDEENRLRS